MIYAKTWVPGTNQELDSLFEILRQDIYNKQEYTLWANYNFDHFKQCTALTISFDGNVPLFCSSILERNSWPKGVYRILNRYWRVGNDVTILKTFSTGSGAMIQSQLDWCKSQNNFHLAFISRQYNHWQKFMIREFSKKFNIEFQSDNYNYRTCETPNDISCWQKIIYQGDSSILESWDHK
jgi:hypothetical protein